MAMAGLESAMAGLGLRLAVAVVEFSSGDDK